MTKKVLKIAGITLASIILLVAIAVAVVVWFVFTPEKLTPIVQEQANQYLQCKTEIEEVELTFFSTFPNFGIKIHNVKLANPPSVNFSSSDSTHIKNTDTLLFVKEMVLTVDVDAYLDRKDLIVKELKLIDPSIFGYIDVLGNTNFEIYKGTPDTLPKIPDPNDTTKVLNSIDLQSLVIKNAQVTFIDCSNSVMAHINGLNLTSNFNLNEKSAIGVNADCNISQLIFQLAGNSPLQSTVNNFSFSSAVSVTDTLISAKLQTEFKELSMAYNKTQFLDKTPIQLQSDVIYDIKHNAVQIQSSDININGTGFVCHGMIAQDTVKQEITTDLTFGLKVPSLKTLLAMIPVTLVKQVKDISVAGNVDFKGTVKGIYSKKSIPVIEATLNIENAAAQYKNMPYKIEGTYLRCSMMIDKSSDKNSYITIDNLITKSVNSTVTAKGKINKLWSDPKFAGMLTAKVDFTTLSKTLPLQEGITAKGNIDLQLKTDFSMSQIQKQDFGRIGLEGNVILTDIELVSLKDTIEVYLDKGVMNFGANSLSADKLSKHFLQGDVMLLTLKSCIGKSMQVDVNDLKLQLNTSDFRDTTKIATINTDCQFKKLSLVDRKMDVKVEEFRGVLGLKPNKMNARKPSFMLDGKMKMLQGAVQNNLIETSDFATHIELSEDTTQQKQYLRWLPIGKLSMKNTLCKYSGFPVLMTMPELEFSIEKNAIRLVKSKFVVDSNDVVLSGNIVGLQNFNDSIPLKVVFDVNSQYLDLNYLLGLANVVTQDTVVTEEQQKITIADMDSIQKAQQTNNQEIKQQAANPFMVPKNVDIELNTRIEKALYSKDELKNINGKLTMRNGIVALENFMVATPGADVKLTAMYKTPRKNHIYLGLDYHMLNIDIRELINMFPDIDTLVPMLRSFGGKAEVHLITEVYTDSTYKIKPSTIKGSASLSGKDLILMDGETFSEIAKNLRFNKKTENKVDSLSLELTMFRNKVDIYPFLIVLDKYHAAVGGKHYLDMTFDYHISLIKSPIKLKLGLDVGGSIDNMKFKLAKPKYAETFQPAKRHLVENEQLNLRKMIREGLVKK